VNTFVKEQRVVDISYHAFPRTRITQNPASDALIQLECGGMKRGNAQDNDIALGTFESLRELGSLTLLIRLRLLPNEEGRRGSESTPV
jgi:hypothetical protein